MDLGLKGKNVLVTGGSKGIGLASRSPRHLEEAGAARRTERVSEGLRAEARRLDGAASPRVV